MYRARETFWAPKDRRVLEGQLVADNDEILKGREGLFDPVLVANPGETDQVIKELLDRISRLESAVAPAKAAAKKATTS